MGFTPPTRQRRVRICKFQNPTPQNSRFVPIKPIPQRQTDTEQRRRLLLSLPIVSLTTLSSLVCKSPPPALTAYLFHWLKNNGKLSKTSNPKPPKDHTHIKWLRGLLGCRHWVLGYKKKWVCVGTVQGFEKTKVEWGRTDLVFALLTQEEFWKCQRSWACLSIWWRIGVNRYAHFDKTLLSISLWLLYLWS